MAWMGLACTLPVSSAGLLAIIFLTASGAAEFSFSGSGHRQAPLIHLSYGLMAWMVLACTLPVSSPGLLAIIFLPA